MTTVLVTGGAGFIGSHVVDYCIDKMKYKTVVLDDLSGGFLENIHKKAEFVQGSITDAALIHSLFQKYQFSYVYHLAAYAAEGLSHFIKRFNYENNLIGSVNLINASVNHNIRCFVFASSIAVYGDNTSPLVETMTPHPVDSYGIAKRAVEDELKISNDIFGLPYVIFRPHNVYGERQNIADKYRNVVGIFMNAILQKKELTIFGDGSQKRAFTYIGDIIPSIAASPQMPKVIGQTINIGSDDAVSVGELARTVMDVMGTTVPIVYVQDRKEVHTCYSDHTKMKRLFPGGTKTPLSEGLQRMAQWVRTQGAKKSKTFDHIEIEKNLPEVWR